MWGKFLTILPALILLSGCETVPIRMEKQSDNIVTLTYELATVDNLDVMRTKLMLRSQEACEGGFKRLAEEKVSDGQWGGYKWTIRCYNNVAGSNDKAFPLVPVAVSFHKADPAPDDVAVIIGNANYENGKDIPDVTPAYADAAGIKKYVIQSLGVREENIIFLKDASQAGMISTFGSKDNPKGQLFNYVKAGKSRVFVYYSGHGAPGGADGDSYIVPTDAQASQIELNGYPLKTLYRNLSWIPARSVTVVLEACFSGASQSGTVVSNASPIYLKTKETSVPGNVTVIAAGAANQIASWEKDKSSGLFTKYFLKGMSGEADAKPYGNGDGKVGYDELGRYFKETLTYYARRYYGREQIPQLFVSNVK